MALTVTSVAKAYPGAGIVQSYFTFTASGSGDTTTLTVVGGTPYKIEFMDANANQIVTSPPTVGAWTIASGNSSSTMTANAGGVVTNGRVIITSSGF